MDFIILGPLVLGIATMISIFVLVAITKLKREATDAFFLNSITALLLLFAVGVIEDDKEVWLRVVSFIGLVATGSTIVSPFLKNRSK